MATMSGCKSSCELYLGVIVNEFVASKRTAFVCALYHKIKIKIIRELRNTFVLYAIENLPSIVAYCEPCPSENVDEVYLLLSMVKMF